MRLPQFWRDALSGGYTANRVDIILWTVVFTAMIFDIVITIYGLHQGLIERNPIALLGINTIGYAVLAYLKVPAILIGFIGWVALPQPYRQLNLVGLSLPWVAAIMMNMWLIVSHT